MLTYHTAHSNTGITVVYPHMGIYFHFQYQGQYVKINLLSNLVIFCHMFFVLFFLLEEAQVKYLHTEMYNYKLGNRGILLLILVLLVLLMTPETRQPWQPQPATSSLIVSANPCVSCNTAVNSYQYNTCTCI